MPELTFYFDLGSPYAYLASERLETLIAGPVRWQPVLLGGLFKLTGRSSWALGDYQRRQRGMAEIERRGRGYALPPLRWPDPWPSDYLLAMRVATLAYRRGEPLGREFTRRAYRAAFQRGIDLSIPAHVFGAAREAGLDISEADAADPEIKAALRAATAEAHARGVFGVPTLAVGDELFWGDDRLASAAAAAAAAAPDKIVR